MMRQAFSRTCTKFTGSSKLMNSSIHRQFHTSSFVAAPKTFFDLQAKDINGEVVDFKNYSGKVCVVVNIDEDDLIKMKAVGGHHGNESVLQLVELRDLYETYKSKGLMIVAFPTRENEVSPGSLDYKEDLIAVLDTKITKEKVKDALQSDVNWSINLMHPVHLNSQKEHQVFTFLKNQAEELEKRIVKHPEELAGEDVSIVEMFTKFLINRKGEVVARLGKTVEPLQMKALIEQLLSESAY